jgi:hypothetical protein
MNRPVSTHVRRWPLILIAAPAAVAIWSGWVGLGAMCGFGPVNLLPGIGSGFHLNTAITLPVGVEAYGAYALGVWLRPAAIPAAARNFAKRSAIGSLVLGMAGQVIFHLLAAGHAQHAPWLVTVLVSCMPVIVLGFGAGLTHLLRAEHASPIPADRPELDDGPDTPAGAPGAVPAAVPDFSALNGHRAKAERVFAKDIEAGQVPGIRRIREGLHVGQPKARLVQAYLQNVLSSDDEIPGEQQ